MAVTPALFPQRDDAGTVSAGADPADHPAQLAEKQAGGGGARLQVSGAQPPSGRPLSGTVRWGPGPLNPLCFSFALRVGSCPS